MQKISVVIICRNEENHIGRCLQSLEGLTDDVVILDNGSTDGTKNVVRNAGARLVEESWEGFGKTKNKATRFAKYDWILNLDADEAIDIKLKSSLLGLSLSKSDEVFQIKFKNFLGDKHLRFGEWGDDRHIRLFNRTHVNWNDAIVHESLAMPRGTKIARMEGYVLHYTANDITELSDKMSRYALLNAAKYAAQGRRSSWINIWLAPTFSFVKYYIFKLGFADGLAGFVCARMSSYYTFIKYARLLELNKSNAKSEK